MNISTKNIYATRDDTYKNLKGIINDSNIAVFSGDKEWCVVIINRTEYFEKLQDMIDEYIENGVYIVTENTTLKYLKLFRSSLSLRNIKIETSVTLRNMNTTKRCCQPEINQDNRMELPKHTSLTTLQILQ